MGTSIARSGADERGLMSESGSTTKFGSDVYSIPAIPSLAEILRVAQAHLMGFAALSMVRSRGVLSAYDGVGGGAARRATIHRRTITMGAKAG